MQSNDFVNQLINAVGSIAELMSVFYKSLLQNGFSESQSIYLTKEFMISTMKQSNGGDNSE